jgi:Fe-S cluster biogenesis protein NfuA
LTREQVEQALDARVRPLLAQHDGDLQVVSVEDGVLRVRMLGQCGSCPSAVVTAQELVTPLLQEALPELKQVVLDTSVSDALWEEAKSILKARRERTRPCASE